MQLQRLADRAEMLFGISLDPTTLDQLAFYAQEMRDWNENRANLTAITDPDEIEVKHFLDSISLLAHIDIPENCRVADIGTGAGFPGLVLKILRPDVHLTLIESSGKKTVFLDHMVAQLNLEDVRVLKMRVESVGMDLNYRETYDLVVARAVAYLPALVEYMLPLCVIDGRCIAMKGGSALAEVQTAEAAIETLGGRFVNMHSVMLPDIEEPHMLIVIDKIRMTPSAFPRRVGVPTKRPLVADE
jgi:16S rRNA (guanine527-N7)-methyltransferase